MTETQPRHRPVVSVVMATYNGRAFLREQLDSIAAQTQQPDELLIIDDGSSDGTPELLAEWARDKPWVRLDRNPRNLGINATFWRLLTESTGDYVFISDQDDVWMPDKIERMQAECGDAELAYSDAAIIDEQGAVLRPSETARWDWRRQHEITAYFFVHNNFVSGHNMRVARRLISRTPEPPTAKVMMYDQWLALSASLDGSLAEVRAPLCKHRIHRSNANNNRDLNKAAAARQGRRERAGFRLQKRLGIYGALQRLTGRDPAFDAFIREAVAGSRGIEQRFVSPALFRTLWQRRHQLFPGAHSRKMLRRVFKLSLGGRAWPLM